MTRTPKILLALLLVAALALGVAAPARAFEAKTGDTVTVGKGEVINDDLYVAASEVTIDGTIKGDLVAAASVITINGVVEGDVIAAAAEVIINGSVGDDVRMAGAALTVGANAKIGDDVVGAGASFESKPGSTIGGDLVMADAQNLLAGEVTGSAKLATAAVELHGVIGGDLLVDLGTSDGKESGSTMPMTIFGGNGRQIQVPQVKSGLTLAEGAKIGGKLEYTYNQEVAIPAGIVTGGVQRFEPKLNPEQIRQMREANPTPAERVLKNTLNILRDFITILLVGLFLGGLFPRFIPNMGETIQQKPLAALGWGVAAWAAFFFSLLLLLLAIILGAIVFGALTLGGLSGLFIWGGLFLLFGLILGFGLVSAFGAQVMVSQLGGKLLLERIRPEWASHRVWPLAVGALLFSLIAALPLIGGLLGLLTLLAGLGALWMGGSAWWQARKAVVSNQ
ncbi:MAG: hypothetical protein Fur0035_13520 [Anaerolineales bacterium]